MPLCLSEKLQMNRILYKYYLLNKIIIAKNTIIIIHVIIEDNFPFELSSYCSFAIFSLT